MEIQDIVNYANEIGRIIQYNRNEKDELKHKPYSPGYNVALDLAHQLKKHTVDEVPLGLFTSKMKNVTKEERDYITDNFQPYTKADFAKVQSELGRIWNSQNWSWKFESEDLEEYLLKDYPGYGSILKQWMNEYQKLKSVDGNAVYALDLTNPYHLDNELSDCYIRLYETRKVFDYIPEQYAYVLTDEKSLVKVGDDEEKQEGMVFLFYDTMNAYQLAQYGDKKDYTFELIEGEGAERNKQYFEHGLGYLPVKKIGGDLMDVYDKRPIFESLLINAKANLDTALWAENFSQWINSENAHPFMFRVGTPCKQCNGSGRVPSDEGEVTCNHCKGSGQEPLDTNFTREIVMAMSDNFLEGETSIKAPLGFVTTDIKTLEFWPPRIQYYRENSFAFIGLNVTQVVYNGQNPTATEIINDTQSFRTAAYKESEQVFNALELSATWIGDCRIGGDEEHQRINKPRDFSFRTEKDITDELERSASAPDSYRIGLQKELMEIRFPNDPRMRSVFNLQVYTDRLFVKTSEEIETAKIQGAASNYEWVLHDGFDSFVTQAEVENPEFLLLPIPEQAIVIVDKAKARANEIQPVANADNLLNA